MLRCSASVSTAVNCNWKHNNTEIKDWHHSSLMLSNISLADEGSYTCEMKGNAGKAVASTAKLKILGTYVENVVTVVVHCLIQMSVFIFQITQSLWGLVLT